MIDVPIAWSQRTADLLALADAKRWGVIRTLRDQNVAEHSFGVAAIVIELADVFDLDTTAGAQAVFYALVHDVAECITGDIDGRFKRDNPELRDQIREAEYKAFPYMREVALNAPPAVLQLVKLADCIETISFIRAWGHGRRADDVYQELTAILSREAIPIYAGVSGLPQDDVSHIVNTILHRILSQRMDYQGRNPWSIGPARSAAV